MCLRMLIEKLFVWIYRLGDAIRGSLGVDVTPESLESRDEFLRSIYFPF